MQSGAWGDAVTQHELARLIDVVEEAEHTLLEQGRRCLVVVGQAVVGEEVPIAGV